MAEMTAAEAKTCNDCLYVREECQPHSGAQGCNAWTVNTAKLRQLAEELGGECWTQEFDKSPLKNWVSGEYKQKNKGLSYPIIVSGITHETIAAYITACNPANILTLLALIEQQAAEIERLKVENNRLRVCGNCRHFEWPKCTVSGKRTTRASICRDWEMV